MIVFRLCIFLLSAILEFPQIIFAVFYVDIMQIFRIIGYYLDTVFDHTFMFGLIYVILRPVVRIYHFSTRVFSFEKLKAFQLYITVAAPEIRLVFELLSRRFEFETYVRLIFHAYAVIRRIYEKRKLRR